MKTILKLFTILLITLSLLALRNPESQDRGLNIDELYTYQKQYKTEDVEVCAFTSSKTYMDYRMTTSKTSAQYKFIHEYMSLDEKTGFLLDKDGFIGVALGSYYGKIGDRFYFTLESQVVLPLVKVEEKSDNDTDPTGCYHLSDNSSIEFVIDKDLAKKYFGSLSNNYILNGNFNNYDVFKGAIVKVEKVLDEEIDNFVTYNKEEIEINNQDIFNYASGY